MLNTLSFLLNKIYIYYFQNNIGTMWVKLRLFIFVYIFLEVIYISDARAGVSSTNTRTVQSPADGDADGTLENLNDGHGTGDLNLNHQSPDVESCTSSALSSLKCDLSKPVDASNFGIHIVQELYQNLAQAVLEEERFVSKYI